MRDSIWPTSRGSLSGVSQMISQLIVRSTQTVHLSCIKISTISKRTELSLEPHDLGVPSGVSKTISKPTVRLAQTVHLSCTETNTVSKRKEVRFHKTHITLEFIRWVQNDFEAYGTLTQTGHLSCVALPPKGPKWPCTWASSPSGTIECVEMISEPMVRLAQTMH
jgi:hypothetical protein